VQQFTYPALDPSAAGSSSPNAPLLVVDTEENTVSEEQAQAREAAAYARGLTEGQQRIRAEAEQALGEAKAALSVALGDFAREREVYFQDIEAEVVALALAIARKILNREAQVDPLVLRGVARAALDRLSAGTTVRLHVPGVQAEIWRRMFVENPLRMPVEVVEDTALTGHECRIETQLGNTHLSAENQLKEIEQGFADLLARAPRNPV
jgi:flagellar assembly protein FliH